ncbi:MAG: helix-turn-helix transcriptional regulator [Chitinophagaceae bacterium]|nr:helix-turn-helix transcriptional regulator [Chitinophagaceae bacterium]
MKHAITSKKAYHETMVAVYDLMNKGEANLTAKELKTLATMAKAAEEYEDNVLGLKPAKEPQTITELLEQKMYENKITQAKLADTLGLGKSKLSEILSGKRKPDVPFLKAVYKKLKVDPAFLLDHA